MNMRCTQSEAVVSVRDTGVGIPVHMLKHVFDLFAQVDRAYDRTSGGLGIGLSVAQRLIQMHEGIIEARSEGVNKVRNLSSVFRQSNRARRPRCRIEFEHAG
jgi:signal transduction histidine kinase